MLIIHCTQQSLKKKEIPKMEENEGCWAVSPCKIFESICIKTCTGKKMKSSTYPSENEDTNLLTTVAIQYLQFLGFTNSHCF